MLQVTSIAKCFRLFFETPSMVRSLLPRLVGRGTYRDFWALRDISFDVAPGDCLGIIGANGSGKSTLLKIIAGVTKPTQGAVSSDGPLSSLLELGAGFHPELTGRENIFLNGAILGLTRRDLRATFGQIVEFSGLKEFIDAKLYTYSSGMVLRLGFSIAIHVPFDLLLIDEIIAVGDLAFQEKCFNQLERFKKDGKTIIVVSHNMAPLHQLCNRVLWLVDGAIQDTGQPEKIINQFAEASHSMP